MAVVPHTIDIVVANMAASLAFYRDLGLPVPDGQEAAVQVEIATPGGTSIGLLTEAMLRASNPHWITPVGQRVTFACRCDSSAEVDAVYAAMVAGGHTGIREPWDSPWGQRYAFLGDPDGNRVDLFAEA
jgi:catechol 2,3-dioxygenase-like lactoylglutathione lyase family enzyme